MLPRRQLLLDGVQALAHNEELRPSALPEQERAFLAYLRGACRDEHVLAADSIATSRGFNVGDAVGEVLLPFGDMLNHACRTAPGGDDDSDDGDDGDEAGAVGPGGEWLRPKLMDATMVCDEDGVSVTMLSLVLES